MFSWTALAAGLVLGSTAPAQAAPACAHDREALLALDVETFDHTIGAGWRPVAEPDGCEGIAADLIAAYRARHEASLKSEDRRGLDWHEGQLRAAAGQSDRAIPLLARGRENSDPEAALYRDATIAFLRGDKPALLDIRSRYAALAKPDWFDAAAAKAKEKHGATVVWPLNLKVIDRLVFCFGKPYREAYGSEACEAPAAS